MADNQAVDKIVDDDDDGVIQQSRSLIPVSTNTSAPSTSRFNSDIVPGLSLMNHPDQCDCLDCTLLYMVQPQEVIDMEDDTESIVPGSPTSSTTTLCASDSDSDQVSYDEELQINVNICTEV